MRLKRTINHTGRSRITRDMVTIQLQPVAPGEPPKFNATLKLDRLKLPESADVYVEAYHKDSTQRFDFGTAGQIVAPARSIIDEVDLSGRLLFRVKVVDNSGHVGRLLASADRLAPEDEGDQADRETLIKVSRRDLGQTPWDLDLNADAYVKPELKLNYRIPDAINQIQRNPTFQALLLPAVIREIYSFIFWDCEASIEDGSWQRAWLDLGQRISGETPPETEEATAAREWIDLVLEGFSKHHGLNDRLVFEMGGGEE